MQNGFLTSKKGFTLIEALMSMFIFSIVVTVAGGGFAQMLSSQRRGLAAQQIQENALFVTESVAREVRYSKILSGDTDCSGAGAPPASMRLEHPVNGIVDYAYDATAGTVTRNGVKITSGDVRFAQVLFCVEGSGRDGYQTRVIMPMTVEAAYGGGSQDKVTLRFQMTVSSRDVTTDL